MRIPCPACGERAVDEFIYHGDATPARPQAGAPPEAWHRYVHLRDNPAGRHRELWFHTAGCRCWMVVDRDLRTHEVFSVMLAKDRRRGANSSSEGS